MGSLASEASERSAVNLNEIGAFVEIVAKEDANSVLIRASSPGSGFISVAVDGNKVGLIPLTNRFNSGDGETAHLYDDGHILLDNIIKAGQTIRIYRDSNDLAITLDFIDLELVPPPIEMPSGFENIADYGAVEGENSSPAIKSAIAAAISKKIKRYLDSSWKFSNG